MATNGELEIYKQRYETFRYLDRLRWQMLQIAVIVGSLILASGTEKSEIARWVFVVAGVLFTIFGITMLKIRHGINKNNQVLRNAAVQVGDTEIPDAANWWKSAGWWISFSLIVLGVVCILINIAPTIINGGVCA